jgi:hypothetical protein
MKIVILYLTLILVSSCKNLHDLKFKFHECEFQTLYWEIPLDKWIDNKQEALNLKIIFIDENLNKRNKDSLYKTTAQYIFSVPSKLSDCSAEIENDTLFISYKPIIYSPEVEPIPIIGCVEFNKSEYPNYKKLKIVFVKT